MLETTPLSYQINAATNGLSRLAETCELESAKLESIPSDSLSPSSDCNIELEARIGRLEQDTLLLSNTNKAQEETLDGISKKIKGLQVDNEQIISTIIKFKDNITKTMNEFITYQTRSLNEADCYYQFSQAPEGNYGYTLDVMNDLLTQANLPTIPEERYNNTQEEREEDDDFDIDCIAESIQQELLEAQYDPLKDNTIDPNIAIALSKLLNEVTEKCSAIVTSKLHSQSQLYKKKKKKHVHN
ncbi:uncharacterized protein SAPINGB_P005021 [Magnusiomyces paraingens]|uniref:Uncharacterized protein n=1 Tax=Magnusiomyces paraingens TaxID=2606893 RepID=A0A5E8BXZ4_9ASCO|nr:uncharacterized protein SAPINGB_P005021 [Saprochaete ingens]VVT56377.1 unnamed protein product [Saprochaete ingens]